MLDREIRQLQKLQDDRGLIRLEIETPIPDLVVGDLVCIAEGALQNVVGRLTSLQPRLRCRVLLELLGARRELNFSQRGLRRATAQEASILAATEERLSAAETRR